MNASGPVLGHPQSASTCRRFLDGGNGILSHPVSGRSVRLRVVEQEGVGRIGEWLDYSDTPDENFRLILASPGLTERLKQAERVLSHFVKDGRPIVPSSFSPAWKEVAPALQAIRGTLAEVS